MQPGLAVHQWAATRPFPSAGIRSSKRSGRRQLHIANGVKEVFMPALSSTMTGASLSRWTAPMRRAINAPLVSLLPAAPVSAEGKVVSWLKSVGDQVNKGEVRQQDVLG